MSSKNAAAARRDEIIAENINFMYGRSKEHAAADSDKRSFVKSNKFINPFDTISDFTGTNNFLLPSYPTDAYLPSEPEAYPSYEHALQASRFSLLEERDIIRKTELIRDVKKMTTKFKSNRGEDWKKNCLLIAERLLRDKFIRSKDLTVKLKGTGQKSLVYANSYGEHFWGSPIDNHSKGQNHLGKLLEKIRNDILKGEDIDLWLTNQMVLISQSEVEIKVVVEKQGEIIETDGQLFERRPKLFIGKADQNDVVTAHSSTSRTHAALVVGTLQDSKGLKAFIVDFLSANGTFVDGVRIPAYVFIPITSESLVTIGASSRSYRFIVDMERNLLAKKMLYDRLANPDILTAQTEEQNNENTVFVGNIPFEASEVNVREFFSVCGAIHSVHMPQDAAKTGEHRGIAFVTFSSSSGLMQALSRGGDDLMGRNIAVKRKEVKTGVTDVTGQNKNKNRIQNEKPSHYTGSTVSTGSIPPSVQEKNRENTRSSSSSSSSLLLSSSDAIKSQRSPLRNSKDDRPSDRNNHTSPPRDRKHGNRRSRSRSRERTHSDNHNDRDRDSSRRDKEREQYKTQTDRSSSSRKRSRSKSRSSSPKRRDSSRYSDRGRDHRGRE